MRNLVTSVKVRVKGNTLIAFYRVPEGTKIILYKSFFNIFKVEETKTFRF